MKVRLLHFVITVLLSTAAHATGPAYFLSPPGAEWGMLGPEDFAAYSFCATPEGALAPGDFGDTNNIGIIRIAGDPGTVVASTNYTGLPPYSYAWNITPVLGGGGSFQGVAFAGGQNYYSPSWAGPWIWVVKTAADLSWDWDAHIGTVEQSGWARAVVQHGDGFLVGGIAYLEGGGERGWRGLFDAAGNLQGSYADGIGGNTISDILPTADGGYLLCTGNGIEKLNSSLSTQWTADAGFSVYDACEAADGSIYAAASASVIQKAVLKFDSVGNALWTNQYFNIAPRGIEAVADGLFIIDKKDDGLNGGSDLWLLKLDTNGNHMFEMSLGGDGDDEGRFIETADDGDLLVAGKAIVDGSELFWLFKLPADIQGPTASFTVTPASPLFRDQPAIFDASASTPPPGDTIVQYLWDFGDGTTNNGMTVTNSYYELGIHDVTLTVVTADGTFSTATQPVETVGLQIQWQRGFGRNWGDYGNALVQARDGGYIVAGARSSSNVADKHLWLFKVDERGIPLWEKFYDGPYGGGERAQSIITAPDEGYMVAAEYNYYILGSGWADDGLMAKVDESGDLLEPLAFLGETNNISETITCAAPAGGGGYFVSGTQIGRPWLAKTDADGNPLWETRYPQGTFARDGKWVSPTHDDGCLLLTGSSSEPDWVLKLDSGGTVLSTITSSIDRVEWIGPSEASADGFDIVGAEGRNIAFGQYSYAPASESVQNWTISTDGNYWDDGVYAAPTLDGGNLILGHGYLKLTPDGQLSDEIAMIKTGPSGEFHWMEILPGTSNINEEAIAAIALTNGAYVVLGHRNQDEDPVFLIKLAPNHPPEPDLHIPSPITFPGRSVPMDASGSTDRDGTVDEYEWDFGDGTQTNGPVAVSHAYTEPGAHTVRLSVVDNEGAERTTTRIIYVVGITIEDFSGGTIVPDESYVTNNPSADPDTFPREGAPVLLDWGTWNGAYNRATYPSSTSRKLTITFEDPIATNGWTLYQMPDWTPIDYTVIDPHTAEVALWVSSGEQEHAFVLADLHPRPVIARPVLTNSTRFALSCDTWTTVVYRVERTPNLTNDNWDIVLHALMPPDPLDLEGTVGTHGQETFYIELPTNPSAFFRLNLTNAVWWSE